MDDDLAGERDATRTAGPVIFTPSGSLDEVPLDVQGTAVSGPDRDVDDARMTGVTPQRPEICVAATYRFSGSRSTRPCRSRTRHTPTHH
ncbi:MAG: hypothetical protein ABW219_11240 [Ilumatobacteraceae bacterium]